MNPNPIRFARWFAFVVGGLDTGTGLGLVLLPAFTLGAMGVTVPGDEALTFVRFTGVFVGSVGASYLLALAGGSVAALAQVFRFTLLFRLVAGAFVAVMVASGKLAPSWLSVTGTDWGIVAVQVWWLRRNRGLA